jgi:transcriptional regulator with XRE-family HTH domain
MTGEEPQHSRTSSFADRLNYLFETVRPDGRKTPYSDREVAKGTGMTATYVGFLRSGERKNPTYRLVQALADFFSVSPLFFFEDQAYQEGRRHLAQLRARKELEDLAADPRLAPIAVNARGLSDEGFADLAAALADIIARDEARTRGHRREPPT